MKKLGILLMLAFLGAFSQAFSVNYKKLIAGRIYHPNWKLGMGSERFNRNKPISKEIQEDQVILWMLTMATLGATSSLFFLIKQKILGKIALTCCGVSALLLATYSYCEPIDATPCYTTR